MTVLLVDDHKVVVLGMKALISQHYADADILCASDPAAALQTIMTQPLDLLITDKQMPGYDGMAVARAFKQRNPKGKVIIITAYEELWNVADIMKGKADAMVFKSDDSNELLTAVNAVMEGKRFASANFRPAIEALKRQDISDRERQVLAEMCEGSSSEEIAKKLCLSKSTVNWHRQNLLHKIAAKNVSQLISKAIHSGVIHMTVFLLATALWGCRGGGVGSRTMGVQQSDSIRMEIEQANAEGEYARAMAIADSFATSGASRDTNAAHIMYEHGLALLMTGQTTKSEERLRAACEAMEAYDKPEDKAIFYTTLGVVLRRGNRMDEAMEAYFNAARTAENISDPSVKANIYNNVAVACIAANRNDEALRFLDKSEKLGIEAADTMEIYSARSSKAAILIDRAQYDETIALLKPAVKELAEQDELSPLAVRCASYLVEAYAHKGMADEAESTLRNSAKALAALPEGHPARQGIEEATADLRMTQRRYGDALTILKDMLSSSSKPRHTIYKNMAECYSQLGDYKNAATCADSALTAYERMKSGEIDKQITEFKEKYEATERELTIARLQGRNTKLTLVAVSVVVIAITLLLSTIAISRNKRKLNEKKRFIDGLETERGRIAHELHDGICNDLFGIELMIDNGEGRTKVKSMVAAARNDIRMISHKLMPPQFKDVSLDTAIRSFMAHVATNCLTSVNIGENDWSLLPKNVSYQLYRIFQECMGNAMVAGSVKISVYLRQNGKMVTLEVLNNYGGNGLPQRQNDGIGSQTMRLRAESIGGKLEQTHSDTEHRVEVTVPID